MDEVKNQSINGYTLLEKIGEGGMAEVWYAENTIGKKAAVKILKPEFSNQAEVLRRFENEARIMVRLDHPNIRQVYDFGNIAGRPCIIMEYLDGADLKIRIKRKEKFTDSQLVHWWNCMAEALNHTHSQNIVHRDIKPSNIFITTKGELKLLDFGISKIREGISLTRVDAHMGTLLYMSPEQVRDSKNLDYRTDLYSLAVTFCHIISGMAPYDTTTHSNFDIELKIVQDPIDLSHLPDKWQQFLKRYLFKDPEQRLSLRRIETDSEPEPQKEKTTIYPGDQERTQIYQQTPTPRPQQPPVETPLSPPEKKKISPGIWFLVVAILAGVFILVVQLGSDSGKKDSSASASEEYRDESDQEAEAETTQEPAQEAATQEYEQTEEPVPDMAYYQQLNNEGEEYFGNRQYARAKRNFEQSCDGNCWEGCRNLGILYMVDRSGYKDEEMAIYYLEKAASHGDHDAKLNLDKIYAGRD